jgi:hypothetical protein
MKLRYRTIETLFAVSKLAHGVILRRNGHVTGIGDSGITVEADVDERFPIDTAFFDILTLLAARVQLGDQTEVTFGPHGCEMSTPNGESLFTDGGPHMVAILESALPRDRTKAPPILHTHSASAAECLRWRKTYRIARASYPVDVVISSDGSRASLTFARKDRALPQAGDDIQDRPEGGLKPPRVDLGSCRRHFAFVVDGKRFSLMPPDGYDVVVRGSTTNAELVMSSKLRRVSYILALAVSTVETARISARRGGG